MLVKYLFPKLEFSSRTDELVDKVFVFREFVEGDWLWAVGGEVESVFLFVVPFDFAADDVVAREQGGLEVEVGTDTCFGGHCLDFAVDHLAQEHTGFRELVVVRTFVFSTVLLVEGEEVLAACFYGESDHH